jgi:hypothetical protein
MCHHSFLVSIVNYAIVRVTIQGNRPVNPAYRLMPQFLHAKITIGSD